MARPRYKLEAAPEPWSQAVRDPHAEQITQDLHRFRPVLVGEAAIDAAPSERKRANQMDALVRRPPLAPKHLERRVQRWHRGRELIAVVGEPLSRIREQLCAGGLGTAVDQMPTRIQHAVDVELFLRQKRAHQAVQVLAALLGE